MKSELTLAGLTNALLLAAPLSAEAWTRTTERGLVVQTVSADGMTLAFVCDPNNSRETDQTSFQISLGDGPLVNGPVEFAFSAGDPVILDVVFGSLLRTQISNDDWNALMEGLTGEDQVVVMIEGRSISLDTGQPLPSGCI